MTGNPKPLPRADWKNILENVWWFEWYTIPLVYQNEKNMGKVNISKGTKFTVAIDSNVVYTISDVYSDVIIVSWQNGAKNQKYQSGDVLSFFETGEWIAINN